MAKAKKRVKVGSSDVTTLVSEYIKSNADNPTIAVLKGVIYAAESRVKVKKACKELEDLGIFDVAIKQQADKILETI